jgi:hypothetical protein
MVFYLQRLYLGDNVYFTNFTSILTKNRKGQQKGFKCQDCHGAAHKKCLDRAEKCEPHHSLRNSQKPEKPPRTREQTQEKIEKQQQRKQQNCTFPLPPIKGERSLQTLVLECEVTIQVEQNKLMYFPGQTINHATRAGMFEN